MECLLLAGARSRGGVLEDTFGLGVGARDGRVMYGLDLSC